VLTLVTLVTLGGRANLDEAPGSDEELAQRSARHPAAALIRR
jgi:hypothetical protein